MGPAAAWRRATEASLSSGRAGAAFTGAVLCGGASRRMGRDKALLPVEGRAMAARVADALRGAGATEVLAVGGDEEALTALGFHVRPDGHPGDGPLPATITALHAAREDAVLVVSCDLIHPSSRAMAATVQALLDHPGAVGAVPVDGGHRQWTHAAWRADAARALVAAYERGDRSLKRAGADLLIFEVTGLDPEALLDADEPGDLPPSG
ncbi:MAG: molybdenum cofactor guanylyltransferase [Acidimicrobiales bacterium]